MDFTTFAMVLLIAVGVLSYDTVQHSDVVELEVITAPSLTKSDRLTLDDLTLEQEFEFELARIAATPSLIETPLIRTTNQDEGVGMAIFTAVNLGHVANSLQAEFGYGRDHIRLTLYIEQGELRGLVNGVDHHIGRFQATLVAEKDEPLRQFVHRCSALAAAQLDPYTTALYQLLVHKGDRDFDQVLGLISRTTAEMPPAPISLDRSLFDNLRGLIALFRNDVTGARNLFEVAIKAYPNNPAPQLNAAFTDVQQGDYVKAAERMHRLVDSGTTQPNVVLASAYLTWAAAEMGRHRFAEAEALLARSTELDPDCAAAFDLWGQMKLARSDTAGAQALHQQALNTTGRFQNYGEIAVLYFKLAWQPGQGVTPSEYGNPTRASFH